MKILYGGVSQFLLVRQHDRKNETKEFGAFGVFTLLNANAHTYIRQISLMWAINA